MTLMSMRLQPVLLAAVCLMAALVSGCGEVQRHDPEAAEGTRAVDQTDEQVEIRQAPPSERRREPAGSVEERVEDAMVETRVLLALAQDEHVGPYPFDVESRSGTVYVRGDVSSRFDARRVEEVAEAVKGVSRVVNEVLADEPEPSPRVAEAQDAEAADTVEPSEEEQPAAPQAERPAAKDASEPAQTFHTVRSGESLWTIARQYDTTIDSIRRLNNMTSNNLRPGQRLRVR